MRLEPLTMHVFICRWATLLVVRPLPSPPMPQSQPPTLPPPYGNWAPDVILELPGDFFLHYHFLLTVLLADAGRHVATTTYDNDRGPREPPQLYNDMDTTTMTRDWHGLPRGISYYICIKRIATNFLRILSH